MKKIIVSICTLLFSFSAYGQLALKLKFDVDYSSSSQEDESARNENSNLNYGVYLGGGWLLDSGIYLGLTGYLQTYTTSRSTTSAGVTTSSDGDNQFFAPGAQIGYVHDSGFSSTFTYYMPSEEKNTSNSITITEERSFMELEIAYGLSAGPLMIGPALDIKRRATEKTTTEDSSTNTTVETEWKENVQISADILLNIWWML